MKILKISFAIVAALIVIGCDSTVTNETVVTETTVAETETVETNNKKVSYKSASISLVNGGKVSEEFEYSFKSEQDNLSLKSTNTKVVEKVNNSIQGELALKEWLFSNIDRYDIFIIDKYGNYIEWFDELQYGEEYIIIDEEIKFSQVVSRAEQKFVFSDEIDGSVITLYLEIQPFFVNLLFSIEDEVYSIYQKMDSFDYNQEFIKTDNGYEFTAHLNEEYIIETYSGDKYSISMTYSNMFRYLQNGEIEMKKLGGIGGVSWDNTNVSFDRMLEGMILVYDSLIDEGKYISFTFDVDYDVEIYFDSEFIVITIDNIPLISGDVLKAGSKIKVEFYNEINLNTRIDIQKIMNEVVCDEIEEMLGLCEVKKQNF